MEENNLNDILGIESSENDNVKETETSVASAKGLPVNKVINVTLTGGIIGVLSDSPQNKLNRIIKRENANGWRCVQIIPAASGNIFLLLIRLIILILTLLLYTPINGYYVIMEKID